MLLLAGGAVHPVSDQMLREPAEAPSPHAPPGRLAEALARSAALRGLRNAWRRRRLGAAVRALNPGRAPLLYHETNLIPVPLDAPCFVTVHDLFWVTDPGFVPEARRRWIERNWPRVLREARGFACVSAHTAGELCRLFPEAAPRARIVRNGVSRVFRPHTAEEAADRLARHGLRDRGYLFAAATLEPRKNLARLAAAWAGLPPAVREAAPLVLAGGAGWGEAPLGVRRLGHVPDQDLAALTARALAYVFVSEKEGFGLPILEAMASGTPLLCSHGSAMEELAGGAALLVEPRDVAAIGAGLRRLVEDAALRRALAEAGRARAAGFRWEDTLDGLVRLWAEGR